MCEWKMGCEKEDKLLLCLLILLCGFLYGIVFIIFYGEPSYTICTSLECNRSAEEYQTSMNFSVNPCTDFYEYTCGNWAEHHPPPNHSKLHDWRYIIVEEVNNKIHSFLKLNNSDDEALAVHQARHIFKICMDSDIANAEGINSLFSLLKEMKIPTVPSYFKILKKNNRDFDWLKSIVMIRKMMNLNLLINFSTDPEFYNQNENRVVLDMPKPLNETQVKTRSSLKKDETAGNEGKVTYIVSVLRHILGNATKTTESMKTVQLIEGAVNITRIEKSIQEVINSHKSLENYSSVEDLRNYTFVETNQTNTTISKTLIKTLEKYLDLMFDSMPVHVRFNRSVDIFVSSTIDMLYFDALLDHMTTNLTKQDIELYIWWKVVENSVPFTTENLRSLHEIELKTHKTLLNHCLEDVDGLLGMAVSPAIIYSEFLNQTKPKIETLFENLRDAFKLLVNDVKWMDKRAKGEAIKKVDNMKSLIGFPEWLLNKTKVNKYYEELSVNKTSHLDNRIEIKRWSFNKKMLNWRSKNKLRWETTPTTINAFYITVQNAINLPLGFIQYPYYYLGLESLNYGTLGAVIGHEITHGFDNSGRLFDQYGNLVDALQFSSSRTQYDEKTKCFIEQYGGYSIPEVSNVTVDGTLTLDENIADNGGLQEAFLAYKIFKSKTGTGQRLPGLERFTDEQLFFISFGNSQCEAATTVGALEQLQDSHAPGRVRVNAVLSNSEDFRKTFRCKRRSPMFPSTQKQCRIW